MTSTTTIDLSRLGDIFIADLERLMPGCGVTIIATRGGSLAARAIHRLSGAQTIVRLHADGETWSVRCGSSRVEGTTAYGFDAAVLHHYRHVMDYTTEHGPGTAWDYAQKAQVAS